MPTEQRAREVSEAFYVYRCDRCLAEIGEVHSPHSDRFGGEKSLAEVAEGKSLGDYLARGFAALITVRARGKSYGERTDRVLICEDCWRSFDQWRVAPKLANPRAFLGIERGEECCG